MQDANMYCTVPQRSALSFSLFCGAARFVRRRGCVEDGVEVEDGEEFWGRDEALVSETFLLLRTQDAALDESQDLLCSIHL